MSFLPIVERQGRKWGFQEDVYPERLNWKTLFVGTGAEIDALDIDTNLVSRYPFNDASNDVVGTNHLTGTIAYASGVYGRCIDPTSQRLQASAQTVHEFGTSDFAFTFWLRMDAISGTQVVIGKRDPASATNKGYRIYVNSSGNIVAEFCDGSAPVISKTSGMVLTAAKWYFVKVTFDRDGVMAIFINQAIDGSVSIASQQATIATNGQTFTVGSESPSGANYLDGKVDQLQVFSAVVSDASGQDIFGNRHAMQLLGCMETGSGFTKDKLYYVNAENTAVLEIVDASSSQTISGKTLSSPTLSGTMATSGATINAFTLGGDVTAALKQIVDAVLVNAIHHSPARVFHFHTSIDNLTTGFTGTGSCTDSQGLIKLDSQSTSDVAKYEYGDGTVNKPMSRDRKFEFYTWVNIGTAVTSLELEFGVYDSAIENALNSTTSNYAVIYFDSSEDSDNWICATGNGSAQTKTVTSAIVAQNSPALLEVRNDEADIKFYINGTLVATHTTNLPNAGTTLFPRGYLKGRSTPARSSYSKFWYWVDHAA